MGSDQDKVSHPGFAGWAGVPKLRMICLKAFKGKKRKSSVGSGDVHDLFESRKWEIKDRAGI